ncbi:hypothetical protein O6H91_15G084300 [Diphasiastrum complanatum]|uniref:Uncharacterized protein n=1 Tax=Diphasiastrum complanatum TaxID=34168 RepID=A0ACC2BL85_DIPCM|nr:hypothetical protein O6H91_15G084300 [Diphasiastrum complanatum]
MAMAMAMASESVHAGASEASPVSSRQRDGDGLHQYYIAVDRQQFKMETLVDLLEVLGRRPGLPLVICCSTRDSLDAVYATVSACQQFSLNFLHSDIGEKARATTCDEFRHAIAEWNEILEDGRMPAHEGQSRKPSHLLVITDACLPSQAVGEQCLSARVLINYDLPSKKEVYLRRIAAILSSPVTVGSSPQMLGRVSGAGLTGHSSPAFSTVTSGGGNHGSGGILINIIVGGEVGILKNIEEGCGIVIDEMPIHISELL